MRHFKANFSSPLHAFLNRWHRLEKPLAGVLLSLGFAAFGASVAQSSEASIALRTASPTLSAQSAGSQPLADGIYLYGQSSEPEQLGAAYMVFEVTNQEVIGAFYMPQSSFDCFQGDLQTDELALTIVNSYEQTAYPYSVALEQNSAVATADGTAAEPIGLEGYHRITELSETDQQILATCKADFEQ